MPDFPSVLLTFLRFGAIAFGGGIALISEMNRVLVIENAWLTPRVFIDGFALGQFVPGPNMLSVVFYGDRTLGVTGAVAAWLGMFTPGAALSILASSLWARVRDASWAQAVRGALLPIGFGLSAGGVLTLAQASFHGISSVILAGLLGYLVYSRRLSLIAAVFVGGAIGAGLSLFA